MQATPPGTPRATAIPQWSESLGDDLGERLGSSWVPAASAPGTRAAKPGNPAGLNLSLGLRLSVLYPSQQDASTSLCAGWASGFPRGAQRQADSA